MLILPLITHAGVISGGGGKGVVCRFPAGNIETAETLDLYEGRVLFGLQSPIESNEPYAVQVAQALERIPVVSRGAIEVYANLVLKNLRFAPVGSELTPINDSFEAVLPKNCKAEQLANYYNDKLILVSEEIWQKLSETNKAALILHEAVYAAERIHGATDSRRTRHVVASLFDQKTDWVDPKDQVPAKTLRCVTDKGGFLAWAFQDESGKWVMQFQILGGNQVMSKKRVVLHSEKINLEEAKTFPILKGDDLIGTGTSMMTSIESNFEDADYIAVKKRWEGIKDQHGNQIPGYQTPKYYVSWISGTYPGTSTPEALLNCSVEMP